MRCAVIQYNVDPKHYDQPEYNNLKPSPINHYSRLSFEKYCAKYDLDFVFMDQPKIGYRHPTWERFDLWLDRSWWDRYDQIMYVDTDVIANRDAPNVFAEEIRNEFTLASYSRYRSLHADLHAQRNTNTIFRKISGKTLQRVRFQTGFFIVNKLCTEHMLPWIRRYRHFNVDDGQVLNWAVMASEVPIREVSQKYNTKYNGGSKNLNKIYFIHAAGGKKHKSESNILTYCQNIFDSKQSK